MNEPLKTSQLAWNIYLVVCLSALALLPSAAEEGKYVMAQKELLLLKSLKLTSFDAYVSDQVNSLFWTPNDEYPRASRNILLPSSALKIFCPENEFECNRVHLRDAVTRLIGSRLTAVARANGLNVAEGISFTAHSLFPFYTKPFDLHQPIETLVEGRHSLYVFKPDLDFYFRSIGRALRSHARSSPSERTRASSIAALRCEPLTFDKVEANRPKQLVFSELSTVPGVQLPEFSDYQESSEMPQVAHICVVTLRDPTGLQDDKDVRFRVVRRIVSLDWLGPHDWLDKNIRRAELHREWRAAAVTALGDQPFYDEKGFLPHTRNLWIHLGALNVDQAINWLEERKEQNRTSLKLFDVSVPTTAGIVVLPLILVALLLNLNAALAAAKRVKLDRSTIEASSWILLNGRFTSYFVGASTLIVLPAFVDGILLRDAVLRAAEAPTIEASIKVWRLAAEWANAPPYWRTEAMSAATTTEAIRLPVYLGLISTFVSVSLGTVALLRIRSLRKSGIHAAKPRRVRKSHAATRFHT